MSGCRMLSLGAALLAGGCWAAVPLEESGRSDGGAESWARDEELDEPTEVDGGAETDAAVPMADPARVAGRWQYETTSSCGGVGAGEVAIAWNEAEGEYDERGHVTWAPSDFTVSWWGPARFDPAARQLRGVVSNTLGDTVETTWQLEGPGPDRLVLEWHQSNDCRGQGIATRPFP